MFRKDGSASSSRSKSDAALRKSDRRRLRDRTVASFPLLKEIQTTEADDDDGDDAARAQAQAQAVRILDDALCGGGDLIGRKLRGTDGHHGPATLYLRTPSSPPPSDGEDGDDIPTRWPYRVTTQPVLLELDEGSRGNDNTLIPCPALLSVLPASLMLPVVVVPPQVSRFLCRGADLMRSGILRIVPVGVDGSSAGAAGGPGSSPPRRGDVVAVAVRGNPQPFGVGFLTEDVALMTFGPGTKGVAVRMLHCYGDDLWKVQLPPPQSKSKSAAGSSKGAGERRRWDDGNYGNPGFVDGERVDAPVAPAASDEEGDDENDDGVEGAAVGVSAIDVVPTNGGEGTVAPAVASPVEGGDGATGEGDGDHEEDDQDALLLRCFHTALNTTVTDAMLPIPVSAFFAGHLLPARPAGTTLDMKKTKGKKIGPFLQEQAELGVISVSPSKDGKDKTAFISAVTRSHPDLRANRRMLKELGGEGAAALLAKKSKGKKLAVVNLYRIPKQVATCMNLDDDVVSAASAKAEARRGTGFLTGGECKSILSTYVDEHELGDPADPSSVVLDGPLCDAMWKRSKKEAKGGGSTAQSSYPTRATRKELQERWMAKMEPAHALVVMPGNEVVSIKRGEPSPISIEVERRQGRKYVTRVRGLEEYGIDGTEFANDASKRFACAATVETEPEGRAALKKGTVEVVLQGNLGEELRALLTGDEKLSSHGGSRGGEYFVPKNVINEKLGKGVAKKKR